MILTIPNTISFIRILLVPVFLWLAFAADRPAEAGWLLGVIGATDWIDGYLARRLDQVSELGKALDPIADRLAVTAAVLGGWISGILPWPIAVLLVARESVLAVATTTLAVRTKQKIAVRYIGKIATAALYVAIPNFYVCHGTDHWSFCVAAWTFVVPGIVLYYVVAAQYLVEIRSLLRSTEVSSPGAEEEKR